MPFVKRDEYGTVIAVSEERGAECNEELAAADAQITKFMTRVSGEPSPSTTSGASSVSLFRQRAAPSAPRPAPPEGRTASPPRPCSTTSAVINGIKARVISM